MLFIVFFEIVVFFCTHVGHREHVTLFSISLEIMLENEFVFLFLALYNVSLVYTT